MRREAGQAGGIAGVVRHFAAAGTAGGPYPGPDHFGTAHGEGAAVRALAEAGREAVQGAMAPLAVQVYIPFCESLCWYCACHKIISRHRPHGAAYVDALEQELTLVRTALGTAAPVQRVFLRGGTPTFLPDDDLERLLAALRSAFRLRADAELSLEAGPDSLGDGRLQRLRQLGLRHLSLGVQDLAPQVLKAVNRGHTAEQVAALAVQAHALGLVLNVDLIAGLPLQTPDGFAHSVEQVAVLQPARITLYRYAHLPQRFRPQRHIGAATLPDAAMAAAVFGHGAAVLAQHGYLHLGLGRFAQPGDALAEAWQAGTLQHDLLGYAPAPAGGIIGLGVSAVSSLAGTCHQNVSAMDAYDDALERGQLPVARGLVLSADDRARRAVVDALLCHGSVDFAALDPVDGLEAALHFAAERRALEALAPTGVLEMDGTQLRLTEAGRFVGHAVATVFDRRLHDAAAARRPRPLAVPVAWPALPRRADR